MRTLLVFLFIAGVGGAAIYAARRPTVASGDVLGALLTDSNKAYVRAMHCDPHIPIGVDGAHFFCTAILKDGERPRLEFVMDRNGQIQQQTSHQRVKRTSDPWGD